MEKDLIVQMEYDLYCLAQLAKTIKASWSEELDSKHRLDLANTINVLEEI